MLKGNSPQSSSNAVESILIPLTFDCIGVIERIVLTLLRKEHSVIFVCQTWLTVIVDVYLVYLTLARRHAGEI